LNQNSALWSTQEAQWPLADLVLRGQHWQTDLADSQQSPVLMLHGWLDNSESFKRLIPLLDPARTFSSIDMAGHGLSDHRSKAQGYPLTAYVCDLAALIKFQNRGAVDLIGHSLGGVVNLMYAAAFPESVRRLVLIDSLGPLTFPDETFADNLRKAIEKRLAGSGNSRGYASVQEAAKARMQGFSPIPLDAAEILVRRNLEEGQDGRLYWRTDPALRHPSFFRMTEGQALACLGAVKSPVLLITAEQGLIHTAKPIVARIDRLQQALSDSGQCRLTHVTVPGGHHCHLESSVDSIAQAIRNFLSSDY